jgi:hypothetical protein
MNREGESLEVHSVLVDVSAPSDGIGFGVSRVDKMIDLAQQTFAPGCFDEAKN